MLINILLNSQINHYFNLLSDVTPFGHLIRLWASLLIVSIIICFLVGEFTGNLSQVDKIWSLMPIVYAIVTLSSFPNSPRIWIMAFLVTFWGLRLTFNFARKGGYHFIPWKGEEDYRWNVLRQHPMLQGFRITLFNLLFIAFFQLTLIMLFSAPLLLAAQNSDTALNGLDAIAGAFMLLFILIETIADNQLFKFHLQKQKKTAVDGRFTKSLEKGFMVDGLWKYVRHPNFAAEQSIWVSFYFFGVAASGQWLNWTVAGPALLILLFIGSSDFTENISRKKYSAYDKYKQTTPKFIPVILKSKRI